jgi:hypothetical protein
MLSKMLAGSKSTPPFGFTLQSSTGGGTGTITVPSSINAGDLGILVEGAYKTPTNTSPASGWVQAGFYQYSTYQGASIWYKKLTTADRSTTLTTLQGSSGGYDASLLVVLRPDKPFTSISSLSWDADGTTSGVQISTFMASTANDRLYIGSSYVVNTSSASFPLDLTSAGVAVTTDFDEEETGSSFVGMQAKIVEANSGNAFTIVGNNNVSGKFNAAMSFYLAFTY